MHYKSRFSLQTRKKLGGSVTLQGTIESSKVSHIEKDRGVRVDKSIGDARKRTNVSEQRQQRLTRCFRRCQHVQGRKHYSVTQR